MGRTSRTLGTVDRLQRYRGHLFNWYDTRTLEPLRPLYVSTVDSGNLAGHLLTLAAGLERNGGGEDLPPGRLLRAGRDAGRGVRRGPRAARDRRRVHSGSSAAAPADVVAKLARVREHLRTIPRTLAGVVPGPAAH